MTREEFLKKLQLCYFGEKKTFNEIVAIYDNQDKIMKETIEKLNLLMSDLKVNEQKEKKDGKSYFNTQLFSIRVKGILKVLERTENK